ncbi:MAG: DUF4388 domain-containing protein [Chitinivibrionales bacterium]|nr:DUF4388 domain-containing protein [Chitinivibrionales bacterium]MBD3355901.1 DUF4388 domain-containing protein [Chitinivibrionales bacterium]
MIIIDDDGTIRIPGERERQLLSPHAGRYRISVSGDGLLVLEKQESRSEDSPRLLMAGQIPRVGWVVEILSFVCNSRLTGILTIVTNNIRRDLFFDSGAIRLARSSAREDLIGEFLVREKVVTREQVQAALNADPGGRKLGQALVDKGFLTLPQLYEQLQKRTARIFNDTVSLGSGIYWFTHDLDVSRLPATTYMDTQAMLMEGLRHLDEINYYRETVPRKTMVLDRAVAVLESCPEVERAFVESVDSRRTLAEIGGMLGLSDEETVGTAHRLVSRGLLELLPRHEVEEQMLRAIVESFNRALMAIYESSKSEEDQDELTRLGRDFIDNGPHNNTTLHELIPNDNGTLNYYNIRKIFESSTEHDRIKLVVIVLTRYLSFILFNAGEHLPAAEQEQLSIRVYAALGDILAATQ